MPFTRSLHLTGGLGILAVGIVAGWIVALTTELTPLSKSIVFSLVSGAMIFTVFKHELPSEKDTHSPTFLISVVTILRLRLH